MRSASRRPQCWKAPPTFRLNNKWIFAARGDRRPNGTRHIETGSRSHHRHYPHESRRRSVQRQVIFLEARTSYLRSEEHTSELQSLMRISYAVFCLKKKNYITTNTT